VRWAFERGNDILRAKKKRQGISRIAEQLQMVKKKILLYGAIC
jgi:hypothetical protein